MSISSSLAHKYDEFDEFSQRSAPKSAYEELKAWCEKHLEPEDFKDVPETGGFFHCIYLSVEDDSIGFVAFFKNGSVVGLGSVSYTNMNAHIEDYKEEAEG